MKTFSILSAFIFICGITISQAQTTATDFTANDCAGNSHHLFTELDAGTVVVLTWVMPCISCIPIASTAATTAQGFSSSYPGRVKFYLVDDYADNNCSTLTGWASTNSITPNSSFSDALISMADYGGPNGEMQKTIVLGGGNHTVFYNVNGAITAGALQTAITNALNAPLGIVNNNDLLFSLSVFPTPALISTKINYTLTEVANVSFDIFNVLGEKINSISVGTQTPGKYDFQLNVEFLNEGNYFINFNSGEETRSVKFSIVR